MKNHRLKGKLFKTFLISLISISFSGVLGNSVTKVENTTLPISSFVSKGTAVDSTLEKITENTNLSEFDEKYSTCRGIAIREISILQLQTLFANEKITAVDLTKCYLERLEHMNPILHAVIETNPDALKDALRLDNELKSGISRSPLHGIPVLIKDGIATADLTETTAGSLALVGIRPKKDADVVTALRKAGAIILGKASLSEFFWFRGSNIPNGWSGRGGQTRNAYNLNVTPEGSSGGSVVAVTANLCTVSVGTETDGSITGPASLGGVCSMKPTYDLVSRKGSILLSQTQDHIGPVARTISDLAILLDAMVPITQRPSHHPSSYTEYLSRGNITQPFRIGVLRHPFWDTSVLNSTNLEHQLPQLNSMLNKAMETSNFQVIDPVKIADLQLLSQISTTKEFVMIAHEFKHGINEYLKNDVIQPILSENSSHSSKTISSLKDIIQFNDDHPTPKGYNQEYLRLSEATDGLLNKTYIDARDSNRAVARQILDSIMEKYNLDAVVTPSDPRTDGISDESLKDIPMYGFSLACFSGYPSINIPAGTGMDGVPFGMAFIGRAYTEPTLLKIAHMMEQLNPQRTPPKFLI